MYTSSSHSIGRPPLACHYRVMASEAGVLLIILRDGRWAEVGWLVVVLVAMAGPL